MIHFMCGGRYFVYLQNGLCKYYSKVSAIFALDPFPVPVHVTILVSVPIPVPFPVPIPVPAPVSCSHSCTRLK